MAYAENTFPKINKILSDLFESLPTKFTVVLKRLKWALITKSKRTS